MTDYINKFMTINFDFLGEKFQTEKNEALNQNINEYNQKLAVLRKTTLEPFQDGRLSKTQTIIAIHKFYKENRELLIKLLRLFLRQMVFNPAEEKHFETQAKKIRKNLREARKFMHWAERIISKPSFEGKPSAVSRSALDPSAILISVHDLKLDHTPDSDKANFILRRFEPEQLDPEHHKWGTAADNNTRYSFYKNWLDGERTEDLTVASAFFVASTFSDEKMKKIYPLKISTLQKRKHSIF